VLGALTGAFQPGLVTISHPGLASSTFGAAQNKYIIVIVIGLLPKQILSKFCHLALVGRLPTKTLVDAKKKNQPT
jgi:hypothetical protein